MRFTIYQESRVGGRANNEDRTTYCYSRDALLMVVADGMGGAKAGEIASLLACQSIERQFNTMDFNELTVDEVKQWLKKPFFCTNNIRFYFRNRGHSFPCKSFRVYELEYTTKMV